MTADVKTLHKRILDAASNNWLYHSTTYRTGFYLKETGMYKPNAWFDSRIVQDLISMGYLLIDSRHIPASVDTDRRVELTAEGWNRLEELRKAKKEKTDE